MLLQTLISLAVCLVGGANGYAKGAPKRPQVCDFMLPGHGLEPQTGQWPYELEFKQGEHRDGRISQTVRITLRVKPEYPDEFFRGFLLQVRDPEISFRNDVESGSFTSTLGLTRSFSCDQLNLFDNTLTHTDNEKKTYISTNWNWASPSTKLYNASRLEYTVTVVKDFKTFWTNKRKIAAENPGAGSTILVNNIAIILQLLLAVQIWRR